MHGRDSVVHLKSGGSPRHPHEAQVRISTCMSPHSIYEQLPLQGSCFRLLEVLPGCYDEPLYTALGTYSLEDCTSFEAISYHWGTSGQTIAILVNDVLLDASSTAAAAIRSCRNSSESVFLWIDQICINQDDLHERSHQVALMSQIYGSAAQVNVCLNGHGEGPKLLFDFADVLYTQNHPCWWSVNRWAPCIESSSSPLQAVLGPNLRLTRKAWSILAPYQNYADALSHDLALFLQNPWFCRAWVVQEATLAKRLVVVCGQFKTSWDALCELVSLQPELYKQRKQTLPVLLGWKGFVAINDMRIVVKRHSLWLRSQTLLRSLRRDLHYAEWSRSLANMRLSIGQFHRPPQLHLLGTMRQFRDWQATDGRDKVFGFLGLSQVWAANGLPFSSRYRQTEQPSGYQVSISDVCLSFAWYHIETTDTLDVLMASCYAASAHSDLPYWVPDWSQTAPLCDTWYGPWMSKWPFSTAGTSAEPEFIPAEKAIMLRGIEVDVVDKVVDSCVDIDTFRRPSDPIWARWRTFAMKLHRPNDPYGEAEEQHFDAFWRTLIYDTDSSSRRATPALGRKFHSWFAGGISPENPEVIGNLIFKERKLFRTKGGYLGNACSNVIPGDKVFLLHGGRLPFILREDRMVEGKTSALRTNDYREDHRSLQGYRMVGGDSYVHGICDELDRRRLQEQYVCHEIALI